MSSGYYWVVHTWLMDDGSEVSEKMIDFWDGNKWGEMPLYTEVLSRVDEPIN